MKKTKFKYLLSIIATLSTITPLIAISCAEPVKKDNTNSNTSDKNKNNPTTENNNSDTNNSNGTHSQQTEVPQELKTITNKSFDELFTLNFLNNHQKTDITPETARNRTQEVLEVKLKPAFESQISIRLLDVALEKDANATGRLSFVIEIKSKSSNKKTIKTYPLTGFKTTPMGISDDGTIQYKPSIQSPDEIQKYNSLNQKQRFAKDNEKYMEGLKRQYQNQGVSEVRKDLKYNAERAKKFNDIAKTIGLDTYENNAYKGLTLPVYNNDGTVEGLSFTGKSNPEVFSDIDFLGRNPYQSIGLARMLPNQTYKDIALQTFIGTFSYKDDFKEDIERVKRSKQEVESWSENGPELKKYKDQLKEIVEQNRTIYEYDYQSRKEKTTEPHDIQSLEEEHKKRNKEFDDEIAKINAYTKQTIIDQHDEKIKKYEADAKLDTKFRGGSGTLSILDYEIPKDGKYPTKWFFATNSHVAKLMSSPTFQGFSLTRLEPNVGLNTKLKISGFEPLLKTFQFNGQNISQHVTKVYDALDYLESSPSQFLTKELQAKYNGVEEMADFAVIEVDFKTLVEDQTISQSIYKTAEFGKNMSENRNANELAKEITNNYVALPDNKKTSFLSTSYLKDYSKIDFPILKDPSKKVDELFALGYPSSKEDFFLRKYEDYKQYESRESYNSLWTNSDYRFYYAQTNGEDGPSNIDEERLKKGNWLSYQIGLRTFADKPGINDAFLISPIRGNELYSTYDENKQLKQYINTGLQYMLRHYVPIGGSSGSSVRNQDYKIVGYHSTIIPVAKTDFVVALRSEGFKYNGAFGEYNLPQYDLIYGGGEGQKTSYRQALEKLANEHKLSNTWIFQHGFAADNIPEEFKFKDR
ncbi:hypothetical protein KQ875_01540 [Mycoplasma zalophi]|uniref:DUF31 domain-containing protein n=1 Tax=Mycoplasma zalophi TaxID=191287 RepID=A0ABS6DPU8_9MOLU|nr:hypothetical protein [Mycoplasma zalophi]MBU4692278.1 hypothetical protein [Mycoplasma zalophi]